MQPLLNAADQHILDAITTWVWSGFYSPRELDDMIGDILEEEANETFLRAAVAPEFAKKAAAEQLWPEQTDCDRLDQAFAKLNACGVVALHNAGLTFSAGLSDVGQTLDERGRRGIQGYCFYHGQDVERAVAGRGLMIAFGDLKGDKFVKTEIGRFIRSVLQGFGFLVDWNGDPESRLNLPTLEWRRRTK